ncbi:hypothetical protein ACFSL6_08670 [Paenibacillus thailandensis]|uniref:Lipoprotein n=1 Tax=Paenibacillus thailandensis TaxID=393250 RepID=A0ABW5QSU1_9BACL
MKKLIACMAGLILIVSAGCSQNGAEKAPAAAESASPQAEEASASAPAAAESASPQAEVTSASAPAAAESASPQAEEASASAPAAEETDKQAEAIASLKEKAALKKTNIMSDKAVILVPESFALMSEEMKAVKYPSGNPPQEVYTNEDGTINVAASDTGTEMTQEDLEAFTAQMKTTIEPTAAEWYEDGVIELEGRKAGHISFLSEGADGSQIYNHMVYTTIDDQLAIVSFNCLKEQMDEWQTVGDTIVETVLVR